MQENVRHSTVSFGISDRVSISNEKAFFFTHLIPDGCLSVFSFCMGRYYGYVNFLWTTDNNLCKLTAGPAWLQKSG